MFVDSFKLLEDSIKSFGGALTLSKVNDKWLKVIRHIVTKLIFAMLYMVHKFVDTLRAGCHYLPVKFLGCPPSGA